MHPEIRVRKTSLCDKMLSPSFGMKDKSMDYGYTFKYGSPKEINSLLQMKGENNFSQKSGSIHSLSPTFEPSQSPQIQKFNINVFSGAPNIGDNKVISASKQRNISLQNALFLIDKAIDQCAAFHHSFGYSSFQIQNCLISADGHLILTQASPTIGFDKISDETVVVRKIIQSISKICAPKVFDDFYAYYRRNQAKNKCDYKYMHSLVRSYCICSKFKLGQKFQISQISEGSTIKYNDFKSPQTQKAVSSIQRSQSSKGRRLTLQEFQKDNIGKLLNICKSQNRLQTKRSKQLKKSVHIADERTIFKRTMAKSNQISMQFNLKISSNDDETVKDSLISTNFKTSENQLSSKGDCIDYSITFCDKFGQILSQNVTNKASQIIPSQRTEVMPFYSANLQQAQTVPSPFEKFQYPKSIESYGRSIEMKPVMEERQIIQNEELLFEHNNWTRKVENLLASNNSPMIQSFIEGKQQYANCGPNPEYLGKLARVVTESFLPPPK